MLGCGRSITRRVANAVAMINSPHCYLICSYAVSRSLLSEAEQEDQQTAQKAAKFGLVRLQQLPSYVKRNVKEKFFMRILGHRGSLSATQYRQEFSSRVSKNFSRTRSLITARVVCKVPVPGTTQGFRTNRRISISQRINHLRGSHRAPQLRTAR